MSGWTIVTAPTKRPAEFEDALSAEIDAEFERHQTPGGTPCWVAEWGHGEAVADILPNVTVDTEWVAVVEDNDTEPSGWFRIFVPDRDGDLREADRFSDDEGTAFLRDDDYPLRVPEYVSMLYDVEVATDLFSVEPLEA